MVSMAGPSLSSSLSCLRLLAVNDVEASWRYSVLTADRMGDLGERCGRPVSHAELPIRRNSSRTNCSQNTIMPTLRYIMSRVRHRRQIPNTQGSEEHCVDVGSVFGRRYLV